MESKSNEKARRSRRRRAKFSHNNTNLMSDVKKFTLPSGIVAAIELGKGKDVRQAQKMSEGDSSMYMNCMMSLLVTIDEKRFVPEDFDELAANDYMELLVKMSEINFTLAQKS